MDWKARDEPIVAVLSTHSGDFSLLSNSAAPEGVGVICIVPSTMVAHHYVLLAVVESLIILAPRYLQLQTGCGI